MVFVFFLIFFSFLRVGFEFVDLFLELNVRGVLDGEVVEGLEWLREILVRFIRSEVDGRLVRMCIVLILD